VIIVLSPSDFIRRDDKGDVLYDSRIAGLPSKDSASWYPGLPPHSLENTGDSEISTINVEMKDF